MNLDLDLTGGDSRRDNIRAEFLKDLDDAEYIELTDFESSFIESNYERTEFTPRQRDVIDKMKAKYGNHI